MIQIFYENTLISCFSKVMGEKIIHHELIHVGKGKITLWDEYFDQGSASLVPDKTILLKGEISLSYIYPIWIPTMDSINLWILKPLKV